jgi:uncharacterized protein (TIGR02466 family)
MNKIIMAFPSSFYTSENLLDNNMVLQLQKKSKKIEKQYPKGGENWKSNVYNTLGTFDLSGDKYFKILLDKIEEKVFEFTKSHGSSYKYKIKESWINIYKNKDYQEYHCHPESTFSCVYFLKSSVKCAKIVFENPTEPDMLPIKDMKQYNDLSFKTYSFYPVQNSLLIFRSYMRHMVEQQTIDFERMSVAVNL